jgi:hypothetical protein
VWACEWVSGWVSGVCVWVCVCVCVWLSIVCGYTSEGVLVRVWVCNNVCVCVWTCVWACVCEYVLINMCMYVCVCVCVYCSMFLHSPSPMTTLTTPSLNQNCRVWATKSCLKRYLICISHSISMALVSTCVGMSEWVMCVCSTRLVE